jgi:hypothetical protein
MATYKEIFGTNIEVLASDPANPVTGQVWYNSTDNLVKGAAATTAGAWATGGNLNTARQGFSGGVGTQSSALGTGGEPFTGATESYNGTSWTEVADLNTARRNNAQIGADNTSALSFAGNTPPNTSVGINESWNGTSWTEVADLNSVGRARQGSGITAAALAFGGGIPGGTPAITNTETWNETSWTEVNDLNTARYYFASSGYGPNTATLAYGGDSALTNTESWNGTSWTEVNDLNTGRRVLAGAGTQASALAFGGYTGTAGTGATEVWNGTSWTEDSDLNTDRWELGGGGSSSTSALAFGGFDPGPSGVSAATEEWTGAGSPLTVTFTDS